MNEHNFNDKPETPPDDLGAHSNRRKRVDSPDDETLEAERQMAHAHRAMDERTLYGTAHGSIVHHLTLGKEVLANLQSETSLAAVSVRQFVESSTQIVRVLAETNARLEQQISALTGAVKQLQAALPRLEASRPATGGLTAAGDTIYPALASHKTNTVVAPVARQAVRTVNSCIASAPRPRPMANATPRSSYATVLMRDVVNPDLSPEQRAAAARKFVDLAPPPSRRGLLTLEQELNEHMKPVVESACMMYVKDLYRVSYKETRTALMNLGGLVRTDILHISFVSGRITAILCANKLVCEKLAGALGSTHRAKVLVGFDPSAPLPGVMVTDDATKAAQERYISRVAHDLLRFTGGMSVATALQRAVPSLANAIRLKVAELQRAGPRRQRGTAA